MYRGKLIAEMAITSSKSMDNNSEDVENQGRAILSDLNENQIPSTSSFNKEQYNVIERISSTKLKLRKIATKVDYGKNDSGNEENLWGEDSDEYIPSENEESSEDPESPRKKTVKVPEQLQVERSDSEANDRSLKKGKKRVRNPAEWKRNKAKSLKNAGKSYISRTGKLVKEKAMGPPCSNRCILKCSTKFPDDVRLALFNSYWNFGTLQRQRDFLATCIEPLQLKYRRVSTTREPRRQNCAFHLLNNGKQIRVCKTYILNTFGITERTIRSVIQARASGSGILDEDKRGRHGKHQKNDQECLNSVRLHISSIPRIESHYQRANTTREFIDGGLSIAELHRNYVEQQTSLCKPSVNYDYYARIFNTEFNLGFFYPKKDLCDFCEGYKNASGEEKEKLKQNYLLHQDEKKLSRAEKDADKEMAKGEESNIVLATYDLQAVLPVRMGQSSAFFYKSRLNCFNFTISELVNDNTVCYFWHEGQGNRGAMEIGSCVLMYIKEIENSRPGSNIIFYSDNCCGQQKNRFVFAMYRYAVEKFEINTITHKFLIRGHTQNEGDATHSVIEKTIKRAKKAGPIYVPDQLVSLIRASKKKGKPFNVKELSYSDFIDLKSLTNEIGFNINRNINGDEVKLTDIKQLCFEKGSNVYFYKTSYKQATWEEAPVMTIFCTELVE